jgi:predicted MFS family arabinose efflux permease
MGDEKRPSKLTVDIGLWGIAELGGGTDASKMGQPDRWRWVMLTILSLDICVSYLPYYCFVPILRQTMQVYGVTEGSLNMLCVLYALAYLPAAFVMGDLVEKLGCHRSFVFAMGLTLVGCLVRCGQSFASQQGFFIGYTNIAQQTLSPDLPPAAASRNFFWLLVGQAICAVGQPILVNSTSKLGAEWFPPNERPTAALVSNLMHFIGGSLSFMLPPLVVAEQSDPVVADRQVGRLLQLQLVISMVSFVATLLLSRPAPCQKLGLAVNNSHSASGTKNLVGELRSIMADRDFWLVNGYFAIFTALCHAFDAVEGSLLDHAGYSAAIASWSALACCVASVLITFAEARVMEDASSYRPALLGSSLAMMVSLLGAALCLHFHLPSWAFVLSIGVMGLTVPSWGCSIELGSEVCFPAREATVSGVLEPFANLAAIAGIIITQILIDRGLGVGVFVLLAATAFVGGLLLFWLSGRLKRTEAEQNQDAEMAEKDRLGVSGGVELVSIDEAPGEKEEGERTALDVAREVP